MTCELSLRVKGLKAHFDALAHIKVLVARDIADIERRLDRALQLEASIGTPIPSQLILDYDQAHTRLENVEDAQRKTFDAWCHALNKLALRRSDEHELLKAS